MKNKPPTSRQFRIDIGLSNEIDILRDGFHIRTSRNAFVESLIRKGIQAEKESQKIPKSLVCHVED